MVEIVPFEPLHAAEFRRLNLEWLQRYFRVEPIDDQVLSHPERIVADGGAVLFARAGADIVGTVALKSHGGHRYELTKMAVTEAWQGRGIARRLLEAALGVYRQRGGAYLFLESSRRLAPALALYESAGFRHEPPPEPAHYDRTDVYMVWRGADA